MSVAKGSCLCGAVHYEVALPFERFMYCHCSRCRKVSGTAHASNGFVKPEALTWTKGADQIGRYEVPEAKRFATQFCKSCGSRLPYPTRDGSRVVIPAGTLDEDPVSRPQAVIFWGSRAAWNRDHDGMPTHDAYPD